MPQGNFLKCHDDVDPRADSHHTECSFRQHDHENEQTQRTGNFNENGIAGTAGISRALVGVIGSLFPTELQFRTIRFENIASVAQLAASTPIVQAGIARYARAVSVARSSPGPIGLGSVGNEPRATPAPDPSSALLSDATSPLLSVVTPVSTAVSTATTSCGLVSNACSSAASLQFLDRPYHVAGTTYSYSKNSGLFIEVSGGAMRDREMSYSLGVQVQQNFDRLWFGGQYQRFLSFFELQPFQETPLAASISVPDGVRPNSVFSDLTGRVGGKINRKLQLETSFSLSNGTANLVVYDLKHDRSRQDQLRVHGQDELLCRCGIVLRKYQGSESTRFSRQRYVGGIQVRFSPAAVQVRKTGN